MHCNLFTSQPRGDPSRPPGAVPDPGVVVGLSPHPEQSPTVLALHQAKAVHPVVVPQQGKRRRPAHQ